MLVHQRVSNHDCWGNIAPKQTRGLLWFIHPQYPKVPPTKTWVDHFQRKQKQPIPQCTPKAPMGWSPPKNNKNSDQKRDPPRRPKPFLRRGFPHVPQLALPGPWVVGPDVGAQPPDSAQLRGDLFAQKPEKPWENTGETRWLWMDDGSWYLRIWANYNNSLTWIKAIWGWFLLLTMIIVRSQWGRYNLPRRMWC